ncbi:hypothetical protein THAOC_30617 [Thalassiosira oceanica]|uniref:WSC domain-containing protein n=1 Tax=Thalassiosira oceanica TaxID=159749 RepID=K0RN98_THAOC|nr:hypothetical protein THAOC_30617 [Thalassiosira oceanica]|eukprot:EJK50416.1 hypothetical protein THAOC_30617 [Thalassiosira oceanica]
MKFFAALVAALSAVPFASGGAADVNGYTGSEYTFVDFGYCIPELGSNSHYNMAPPLEGQYSVDECAAHCQSFNNIEGHVGFEITLSQCYCRYTDGTGPESATTEEGITYESITGSVGAISAETDGNNPIIKCYRHNAFGGAYMDAYTGSDFTLVGKGYCIPEGSTTHYSHAATLPSPFTMDECAAYCLGFPNTEGLVAMEAEAAGRCLCRYDDGTGPEKATNEDGILDNTDASGPVAGTDGDTTAICWTYNWAFGNTAPPTVGPSNSPSKTPTGSPTKSESPTSPSTSPSKSPTGSPSQGPSTSVVATAGGAAIPEDSLYYPDWSKSNGGCKTGGGQPTYMTLDASTWMLTTLDQCCKRYFGWMLNECKGTSGAASSGLWFPDWEGLVDTCKNDGSEPEYMALNPGSWMHSSKQGCCEVNFGWMLNECLGSSASSTDKWFMVYYDEFKCKKDCVVGTGPSCGGRAESWDELFDTRSACCAEKAAWNPTDCLVD